MMNVILFGPPGVGKSTLIGILKTKGFGALDLEDLYPNKLRFQVPSLVDGKFLGAADLRPARKYRNAKTVLVWSEQKQYDQRRKARDVKMPGKSNQKEHVMNDWLKGVKYDLVLDTTNSTAEQSAQQLADYFKEVNGNGTSK